MKNKGNCSFVLILPAGGDSLIVDHEMDFARISLILVDTVSHHIIVDVAFVSFLDNVSPPASSFSFLSAEPRLLLQPQRVLPVGTPTAAVPGGTHKLRKLFVELRNLRVPTTTSATARKTTTSTVMYILLQKNRNTVLGILLRSTPYCS